MTYRLRASLLCALVLLSGFGMFITWTRANANAHQQQNIALSSSEGLALKSLRELLNAEVTFQTTIGKGEYGDLKTLHGAGLIDKDMANGVKGGYRFSVEFRKSTLTIHPAIDLVARPIEYGKVGRRSFYVTESGVMLTSVEKDAPLSTMLPFATRDAGVRTTETRQDASDPETEPNEDEIEATVSANEAAVKAALGTILAAEARYLAKDGGRAYGTLAQLEKAGLLSKAQSASTQYGYLIEVTITQAKPELRATFSISAVPETYGGSGRRSFFTDQTGMLRGGDKEGGPAEASDPVIK